MKHGHVLALSGGVGGAKLCAGLAAALPPERLTMVVNVGDDFEHLGLMICPDLDSVVYTLAGLNDASRGWGVRDEGWRALDMLGRLNEAHWFKLGDRDLAMHIARSWRLRAGETLSEVTARLTGALGIAHSVAPASDDDIRTQVRTDSGWQDFQTWFVAQQCRDKVWDVRYCGAERARMSPAFEHALARSDLAAIVICPSNPFLSIDPILAIENARDALRASPASVVAVSPLVGGRAVKGPLTKLLLDSGRACSNDTLGVHYGDLVDHWIIHASDADDAQALRANGAKVSIIETLMHDRAAQVRVARETLERAGVEV